MLRSWFGYLDLFGFFSSDSRKCGFGLLRWDGSGYFFAQVFLCNMVFGILLGLLERLLLLCISLLFCFLVHQAFEPLLV